MIFYSILAVVSLLFLAMVFTNDGDDWNDTEGEY